MTSGLWHRIDLLARQLTPSMFTLALVFINVIGVRSPLVYALLGIVIWVSFFKSGIHPTVAVISPG